MVAITNFRNFHRRQCYYKILGTKKNLNTRATWVVKAMYVWLQKKIGMVNYEFDTILCTSNIHPGYSVRIQATAYLD